MDVTWDVAKECQTQVYEEVCAAARDHEDTDWWQENRDQDDEYRRCCVRVGHFGDVFDCVEINGFCRKYVCGDSLSVVDVLLVDGRYEC